MNRTLKELYDELVWLTEKRAHDLIVLYNHLGNVGEIAAKKELRGTDRKIRRTDKEIRKWRRRNWKKS